MDKAAGDSGMRVLKLYDFVYTLSSEYVKKKVKLSP
jgi:hypothetical protein